MVLKISIILLVPVFKVFIRLRGMYEMQTMLFGVSVCLSVNTCTLQRLLHGSMSYLGSRLLGPKEQCVK